MVILPSGQGQGFCSCDSVLQVPTVRATAPACQETLYTFGHSDVIGHSLKDYTKKTEYQKYATYLRFIKPNSHVTGVFECPAKADG